MEGTSLHTISSDNELVHTFIKVSHSDDDISDHSDDGMNVFHGVATASESKECKDDYYPPDENVQSSEDEIPPVNPLSGSSSEDESYKKRKMPQRNAKRPRGRPKKSKVVISNEDEILAEGVLPSDDESLSSDPLSESSSDESYKKRKSKSQPQRTVKKPRGRPRKALVVTSNDTDVVTDEVVNSERKTRFTKPYDINFKLNVLTYAENHKISETARKFGIAPKRIREWKNQRSKIELESAGGVIERKPRGSFTIEEKLKAIAFAEEHSIEEAKLLYNVDKRTVEKWRQKKAKYEAIVQDGQGDRKRRVGCGRKPKCTHIEDDLRDWVVALRFRGVAVNTKMILQKVKELLSADTSSQVLTPPSTQSWVVGFLKRQNLNGLLLGNTLGYEDPEKFLLQNPTGNQGEMSMCPPNPADLNMEIPENPNKRNKRSITLEDKYRIIQRINDGESQTSVARSLKVPNSTIQTIWSCRKKILQRLLQPQKFKNVQYKRYSDIESTLLEWYKESTSKDVKIDGQTLVDKAIAICEMFAKPEFKRQAAEWTEIFCRKHCIKDITIVTDEGFPLESIKNPKKASLAKIKAPEELQSDQHSVSSEHQEDITPEYDFMNAQGAYSTGVTGDLPSIVTAHSQNLSLPAYSSQSTNNPQYSLPPVCPPSTTTNISSSSGIINLNHILSSTTSSASTNAHVETFDAINSLNILRKWIQNNFGHNEDTLNNHLNAIENAIFKKRVEEVTNK